MRGTGFFVIKDGNGYFITNRHVIEPGYGAPHMQDVKSKKLRSKALDLLTELFFLMI